MSPTLTSTHTREAESPTNVTPFSPATLMAVVHTEADSGTTAFILSRLLFEKSSLTLAVAMLLVLSDIVLDAIDMETPSLPVVGGGEERGGEEGRGKGREVRN